jgi:hypothetical protein
MISRKIIFQIFLCIFPFVSSFSQESSRISLSANFGINGNFFVRSYGDPGGPVNKTIFYEKDFIGIAGGADLRYKINSRSGLGLGYMRSQNKKDINYDDSFNSIYLRIMDFNIRHIENIFQFYYERNVFKKIKGLDFQIGIFYTRTIQQEIELANYANSIFLDERNFKNSRLNELGAFFGVHYSKQIDTKFELGIQSRIYYEISSDILAQITLTPTLTYHFSKPKAKRSSTTY